MAETQEEAPSPPSTEVVEIPLTNAESASLMTYADGEMEIEPAAPHVKRLSNKIKICFSIGEIGGYVLHMLIAFYLQTFLLNVAKIDEYETGHIFLIGQLWVAFANPLIGYLSDRTRTRWGRRRPWILFSAIPIAICQCLLWQTPDISNKFLYYCVLYLTLNTSLACTAVPYTSMTPEIAPHYDDSTALTSFRFLFGLISGLISLVVFLQLTHSYGSGQQDGYSLAGIVFAVVGAAPSVFLFAAVPEKSSLLSLPDRPQSWRKTAQDLLSLAKNRSFITVCLIYLLCWVSTNTIQTNFSIYLRYVLHLEQHELWILIALQLAVAVGLVGWQYVCNWLSKRTTFCIGVVGWAIVHVGLFFIPPRDPVAIYVLASLAGLGVGLAFLLPWSMLPDVVEEDELLVGEKREGLLYSVFVVLQQAGIAGALAAASYALGICGYVKPDSQGNWPEEQPASVVLMLQLLVGPIPAFVLMLALCMGLLYPITRERIVALLAERRARARSVSPLAHTE